MKKVVGLLSRYNFIDLAAAISKPRSGRKSHLQAYVDRSRKARFQSYEPLRRSVATIYGVERGLDPSPRLDFEQIQPGLEKECKGKDIEMNVGAGRCLFDFIRPRGYRAYHHDEQGLRFGPDRVVAIRIQHYVVDGDRAVFHYVYPRREPLTGQQIQLMLSLIYHAYVRNDFAEAGVEIADLSCDHVAGPRGGARLSEERSPCLHRLSMDELLTRDDLQSEVQNIYDLLIEIGNED
jgi:hypothetical protein